MASLHAVRIVLRLLLLAGSAYLIVVSLVALRRGRKGYRPVLLWAFCILALVTWRYVTGPLSLRAPMALSVYGFRCMLAGALATYGLVYVVPFVARDCKQVRAARKRALERPTTGDGPIV